MQGKSELEQRNLPYRAIRLAFTDVIMQILSEDEQSVADKRNYLLSKLDLPTIFHLFELLPSLRMLFTESKLKEQKTAMGPLELENIYASSLEVLMGAFYNFSNAKLKQKKPIVLFIDDLQWTTESEFRLLKRLLSSTALIGKIFFVGGFRDNEIEEDLTHPFRWFLNELESTQVKINKICLQPLPVEEVSSLLRDTLLGDNDSETQEMNEKLAEIVYFKTRGNPFFVRSFLTRLYQDGLLNFNSEQGKWTAEVEEIKRLDYTDNVIEFLSKEMTNNLSQSSLYLLSVAAMFGSRFNLEHVSRLPGTGTVLEVEETLWKACSEGYIILLGDLQYRFLHDKVQEAVIDQIPNKEHWCKEMHWRIGNLFLDYFRKNPETCGIHISSIAEHFKQGEAYITGELQGSPGITEGSKVEIVQVEREAAKTATQSMAYDSALSCVNCAIHILSTLGNDEQGEMIAWNTYHKLTYELFIEKAKNLYLVGDINEDETQRMYNIIAEKARDLFEKVQYYNERNCFLTLRRRFDELISFSLEGLKLFDIYTPPNPSQEDVEIEVEKIETLLDEHRPPRERLEQTNFFLLKQPVLDVTNEYYYTTTIISDLMAPCWFANKLNLSIILCCKLIYFAMTKGIAPVSGTAFAWFGWRVKMINQKKMNEAYHWRQLSYSLGALFGWHYHRSAGATRMLSVCLIAWPKEPLAKIVEDIASVIKLCIELGDYPYAAYAAFHAIMISKYTREHNVNILDRLSLLQEKQNQILRENTVVDLWLAANTEKRIIKYLSRFKEYKNEEWLPEDMYIQKITASGSSATFGHYYCTMTYCLYLLKKYKRAIKYAETCLAKEYFVQMIGFVEEPAFYFSYSMSLLAYIKHSLTSARTKYDEEQAEKYDKIVRINKKNLKVFSDSCPMNFQHFYKILEAEHHYVNYLRFNFKNKLTHNPSATSSPHSPAVILLENAEGEVINLESVLDVFKQAIKAAESFGMQREIGLSKELLLFAETQLELQLRKESVDVITKWGASLDTMGDFNLKLQLKKQEDEISQTTSFFEAVLQASKISSSGNNYNTTEALLCNFVNITSEISNANYTVVILSSGDDPQLYVCAVKSGKGECITNKLPYHFDHPNLPNDMLTHCWEKGLTFSLSKPADGIMFKNDKYFITNHPANVMCKLLEHKEKACGILYLEKKNTEDLQLDRDISTVLSRVVLNINILTAQLLTSLENTWLIGELESQSVELMSMNKRLLKQEQQKRAMLETMGHETKTPLNIIFGMARMLEEGELKLDKNHLKSLKAISSNADRLLNLVNEMLRQNS